MTFSPTTRLAFRVGLTPMRSTLVAMVGLVMISRVAFAADATPPRHHEPPRHHAHVHVSRQDMEAAREERERREDLERRVERLERMYELDHPAMPPAEPRPDTLR